MLQNSIQPRFAAFMASHGRTDFENFNTTVNRADFMAWIGRCKRTAPVAAVANDRVVSQDAFTAHCWQVARDEIMAREA
ncbi:hypothetical protein [Novosphingobium sp. HII-3]|uniref:hypothetical protein n=1 Tax=Novosphingobium sp. HII-3 TaxID=2075565 RepID=UPI000CDAA218|nr:hypothetical protein [Novosphingobium sp. HII-3]